MGRSVSESPAVPRRARRRTAEPAGRGEPGLCAWCDNRPTCTFPRRRAESGCARSSSEEPNARSRFTASSRSSSTQCLVRPRRSAFLSAGSAAGRAVRRAWELLVPGPAGHPVPVPLAGEPRRAGNGGDPAPRHQPALCGGGAGARHPPSARRSCSRSSGNAPGSTPRSSRASTTRSPARGSPEDYGQIADLTEERILQEMKWWLTDLQLPRVLPEEHPAPSSWRARSCSTDPTSCPAWTPRPTRR